MKLIGILLCTLLFTLCASATLPLDSIVLNQQPLKLHTAWSVALDNKGDLWTAYYATDGQLYLRRPNGSEVGLAPEGPRALSGLDLELEQDKASVMWRNKASGKKLYYLPDAGGEKRDPILIDTQSEPLLPYTMAHSGGERYFLWVGERPDFKTRELYHVYFSRTEQNGQQPMPAEQLFLGIYTAWIITDQSIPVFTWATVDNHLMMAFRQFDRQSKQFGPLVKITDAPPISPYFHAFASGNRWFLLWVGHYGKPNTLGLLLEGVYSDDRGQTWKRFAFEELRELNFSKIDIAADGEGHLLMAVSGRWSDKDPKAKGNVYMLHSDDNGTTWSKPYTLRMSNLQYAAAQYPSVAFGSPKGSAVVIWEDWRDIRGAVYASFSQDYGQTWQQVPVALNQDKSKNFMLHFENKSLLYRDGRYYAVAQRYADDNLSHSDLVLYTFTLQDLQQAAPERAPDKAQATEARLRERVAAYWQAVQNDDYASAYALFDPFFRAKVNQETFIKNKGRIKYHDHKIESIELHNSLAKVKIGIEASVPEFKVNEQVVSRPKAWRTFDDTWLFIDGDWYREYYHESGEARYTIY